MHLVAPLDKHFSLLYVLLKEHIADDVDYKVIVIYKPASRNIFIRKLLWRCLSMGSQTHYLLNICEGSHKYLFKIDIRVPVSVLLWFFWTVTDINSFCLSTFLQSLSEKCNVAICLCRFLYSAQLPWSHDWLLTFLGSWTWMLERSILESHRVTEPGYLMNSGSQRVLSLWLLMYLHAE